MSPRKYTKQKRAEQQEATRKRIVEAVMDLHEDLGPARTTVSAIAERAGVQRLTVYRHFPDESALLEACTTRWLELHPMPSPEEWNTDSEPLALLTQAFRAFYRYYRRTEAMWSGAYRDIDLVPALAERMKLVVAYLDALAEGLTRDASLHDTATQATVRHALEFSTWQSLSRLGLTDDEAADLVVGWVEAARRPTSAGRPSG